MRCAIWIGGRAFRVEERPVPEPGPGEVRVRVHACGVCLTEVHTIDGLLGQARPPALMGHEFGGIVDSLGAGVDAPAPGTAVACAGRQGYAEYAVLPADRAFPLPPGVPVEHAALVEPIVCCATAVQNADLPMGATVLVTGAGPMGLLTLQLARRGGAARVVVSEPNPARRALALRLGADLAVDPREGDMPEAVRDLTRGRGADAAFECAGLPDPLADCLRAVAREGTVVMVGVNPRTARLELDLYDFHYRYLRLIGSYGGAGRGGFRAAVEWLGQLDLAPLISHRFDLVDAARAFDVARTGQGLKVLVGAGVSADSADSADSSPNAQHRP
jgi:L-iditol 2-dehydrogenase